MTITQEARRLADSQGAIGKLQKAGFEAYWVGGSVRDMLLGKKPKDFDIVTSASPRQIEQIFPRNLQVGKKFGIIIVTEYSDPIEIATFRQDLKYLDGRRPSAVRRATRDEDAARRDFTVNGIMMDPATREVIDIVGGRKDLKKKMIRTIGSADRRFKEDHLRMLRAIRFSVQLGFKIEKNTWIAICKNAAKIKHISVERIRSEILKIFSSPEPDKGLFLLESSGLLKHILPEVLKMKGVPQSRKYHPEGDVFRHTALVLKAIRNAEPALIMAALLHDIEKPSTFFRDRKGTHFYGHEVKGAETARRIMKRLRFSKEAIEKVEYLIRNHLKWYSAREMRKTRLQNYMAHPYFPLALELLRADSIRNPADKKIYRFIMAQLKKRKTKEKNDRPLLMGRDLIRLGIKQGPIIGEILKGIEEKRLDEHLKDAESAKSWVKKMYFSHISP